MDYVIVMLGLVFIADIIWDAFKSFGRRDCEEKKIQELEGRVKKLEERLYEQKV